MKVDIVMPKMGESINEGTIIKWHKKIGDKVIKDEIIFEISTDKVDTEIPSPVDGILAEIRAYEHETVPIGEVVGVINTQEENEEKVSSAKENKPTNVDEIQTTDQVGSIIDIPMPKMGESVMEGTIIKWHKKVGDEIKADEILYEISTDKVDTEVPSPADGILHEILVNENETVEVGVIVARISTNSGFAGMQKDDENKNSKKEKLYTAVSSDEKKVEQSEKISSNIVEPRTQNIPQSNKLERGKSSRFYSPLVINIAAKEGVSQTELELIKGSGIGGRVTKNDILNYINTKGTKQTVPAPELKPSISYSKETVEILPMDNIRKRIKDHMIKSRDTSVHVSEMMEVDMTKIHNFIENNREKFLKEDGLKLTYMAFISYAAIKALKEYPLVNSSIDGDNILIKKNINLGIAVAVEPNGLIVPNIKNADEKNIRGLAKAIADLSNKARNKGLLPDDIMGGTFSITNYGVFGALFGTPIINQPEVAILGVGAVVKKPVVIELAGNDVIAIKPMMYLSLSHDHRLVDGMLGGMFLKYVKEYLENFDVSSV